MQKFCLKDIQPHIRYVNNYRPMHSYTEKERILYDHEFMYVMAGEVEMHYGGRVYALKKGDLFHLRPFVTNYIVVDESKGFRTHCIHFDWLEPAPEEDFTAEEYYMHNYTSGSHARKEQRLRRRSVREPEDFAAENHIMGIPYEQLSNLFARCYYNFSEYSTAARLKTRGIFYEILAVITEHTQAEGRRPVHPQIKNAVRYVKDNYRKNLTVYEMAEKYGLSPKYFGTLFKQAAGMPFREFVLQLRIHEARDMLLGTDMSIEKIAEETGFQNAFYFSKCFKEAEQVSPTEYRRAVQERRF